MKPSQSMQNAVLAAVHGDEIFDEAKVAQKKEAAVEAAREAGVQSGRAAQIDRFRAALGAQGISGDGVRMTKALNLLVVSPDMSAEAVASFVLKHAGTRQRDEAAISAYEQSRIAAAGGADIRGAAMPDVRGSTGKLTNTAAAVYAARKAQTGRFDDAE